MKRTQEEVINQSVFFEGGLSSKDGVVEGGHHVWLGPTKGRVLIYHHTITSTPSSTSAKPVLVHPSLVQTPKKSEPEVEAEV